MEDTIIGLLWGVLVAIALASIIKILLDKKIKLSQFIRIEKVDESEEK